MNKTTFAAIIIISILALSSCQKAETMPNQTPQNTGNKSQTPNQTPGQQQVPKIEIKSSEVSSLALNTIYKGFFAADSKCHQSYNELFGKEDGFFTDSSPCTIDIVFDRDGSATKTIRLERWDKESKQKKTVEKTDWKATLTTEQFDELAKSVIETEIFQNWNDMMMINVVNSRIKATYPKGSRTLMSNVDEKTVSFLPLMNSFKQLDGKLKWEKSN
jgi:hypothetical protein